MNDTTITSDEHRANALHDLRPDPNVENILTESKNSRALGVIIIVLFIGILLSFLVNFGLSAYLGSEDLVDTYYDGKEHSSIVFGGFADTFYLSENIRQNIVRVDYYLFRRLPTDSVLLGKDEFLFPTYDEDNDYNYVADYLGELYLDSETLNKYYQSVIDITRAYEELGVACYFVIIPNSQTVYPEKMPDFMGHTSERTRLVSVSNYLARRSVTNFLNLTDPLVRAKDEGELYNNTENSLNSRGAYYAYLATLNILPQDVKRAVSQISLSKDDLVLHRATGKELARAASLENIIKNRTVSLSADFVQKYQILLRYDNYDMAFAKMLYKDELPESPRVAFKFSDEWDRIIMIDYFSNTFGTTIYSSSLDFDAQMISKTSPDYMICFIHENALERLIDGSMLPQN